jgi:Tol biopolymer transport system component
MSLAKEPDDRWQNAHDLAAELRWLGTPASGPVSAPPGRRRKAALAQTGIALLLTLLGIAAGLVLPRGAAPPPPLRARFEVRVPERATLAETAGLALSPGGDRVVFRASAEGGGRLYVRPLDGLSATPIPGTEQAVAFFWSPDGRQIAFQAERKLKRVDLSGGPVHVLYDDASGILGGDWSPDGKTIILSGHGNLLRLPAGGGKAEPLGTRAEGETRRYWPRFLPDGSPLPVLLG